MHSAAIRNGAACFYFANNCLWKTESSGIGSVVKPDAAEKSNPIICSAYKGNEVASLPLALARDSTGINSQRHIDGVSNLVK